MRPSIRSLSSGPSLVIRRAMDGLVRAGDAVVHGEGVGDNGDGHSGGLLPPLVLLTPLVGTVASAVFLVRLPQHLRDRGEVRSRRRPQHGRAGADAVLQNAQPIGDHALGDGRALDQVGDGLGVAV